MKNRIAGFTVALLLASITLWIYTHSGQPVSKDAFLYYKANYLNDTGAENAVTGIYLNYRFFDTLFEALMLLLSVIGIIYFSRHKAEDSQENQEEENEDV